MSSRQYLIAVSALLLVSLSATAPVNASDTKPQVGESCESGKRVNRAKYANPQMAWPCRALSLKKNGDPTSPLKAQCADGVQKFTSSKPPCASRNSYQP